MKIHSAVFFATVTLIIAPTFANADLISKDFVQPGGKSVTTGIIFQGSRNMRDLGKRRATTSHLVVPSLNPVTVLPALENEELQPKPRFGYGSDFQSQTAPQSVKPSEVSADSSTKPTTVYSFQYRYPVYRDYWVTRPLRSYRFIPYGTSYSYSGWNCGGWSRWGFGRVSLSFGW